MNYLMALHRPIYPGTTGLKASSHFVCGFRRLLGKGVFWKRFCGEEILRKIIIIMSDAREEAAIAREALVRGKKKQKKQTTLMTKWNIVLDYGESGVSMADYCAEYNGREGRALGVVIEESKLCRWKKASVAEDWESYISLASQAKSIRESFSSAWFAVFCQIHPKALSQK